MMRYIILTFILLTGILSKAQAQVHITPEFGQVFDWQGGFNDIGPVRTISRDSKNSVTAISLTIGYPLDKRWEASMRLRYFTGLYGFLAADLSEDNGIFGPVIKAKTIGVLTINIQPTARLKLLTLGKFSVAALAGPSMLLQFPVDDAGPSDFNGRHPNTAAVVNQINDSVKPFCVGVALGGVITYWRLSLTVDYHNNLNASFTNDLTLDGETYTFNNSAKYLGFSLGYRLLGNSHKQ